MDNITQTTTIAAALLTTLTINANAHTIVEQIEETKWYKNKDYTNQNPQQTMQVATQNNISITQEEQNDINEAITELRQQGRIHRLETNFKAGFRNKKWANTFSDINEYNKFCDYVKAQLEHTTIYQAPQQQQQNGNQQTGDPVKAKTQQLQLQLFNSGIPCTNLGQLFSNQLQQGQQTYNIDNKTLPLTTIVVLASQINPVPARKTAMNQLVQAGEFKYINHSGKKIYYQLKQQ